MYLVDTNVISAAAPTKKGNDPRIKRAREWLDRASDDLYLSVISVAEIQDGISKLFREGATRKASQISQWWMAVEHLHGKRILPFDLEAAHTAGKLLDRARAAGHTPGFADVAVAAIALSRGYVVLTDNVRHFEPLTAGVLNPFEVPFDQR